MVRDQFKDEKYFGTVLAKLEAALTAWRKSMAAKEKPTYNEFYVMSDGLNDLISLAYSFGWPTANLVEPCKEMLENYTFSIDPDADYSDGGGLIYAELLEMISKGILLDTKDALSKLATKLRMVGYQDYLISFLLHYVDPTFELSTGLLWPEDLACRKLQEITLSNLSSAESGLKEYLESFFYTRENMEDSYGSHKRTDNSYDGYWSFESAAIAKVMELNDDILREHRYYPYDMRHGDKRSLDDCPPLTEFVELSKAPEQAPVKPKKWWKIW